jgi:VIT1/CCC1 family predicted Fe2+/Mn2+ transporter
VSIEQQESEPLRPSAERMTAVPIPRVRPEEHMGSGTLVRDVILGMSDGLTVPFALAAGLSGAVHDPMVVVVAGLAEMAAGAVSMGLGGYLAGKSDSDRYHTELAREHQEVRDVPEEERAEVRLIFRKYGLRGKALEAAVTAMTSDRESWVAFMMREELGLEEPDPGQALRSGITIGLAYIIGGSVPLAPYALRLPLSSAFPASIVVTLIALVVFGALKGHFTGMAKLKSAIQVTVTGAIAAGVAYGLARLVSGLAGT